jgi:hypothetical protein
MDGWMDGWMECGMRTIMTITDNVIRSVLGSPDPVVVASNNVTYVDM